MIKAISGKASALFDLGAKGPGQLSEIASCRRNFSRNPSRADQCQYRPETVLFEGQGKTSHQASNKQIRLIRSVLRARQTGNHHYPTGNIKAIKAIVMKFIYYSLGVLLVIAWGAGCLKYPHNKEVHLLLAMALLTGSVLSYRKKPVVLQDPKQAT
jgi:hypothetical protein